MSDTAFRPATVAPPAAVIQEPAVSWSAVAAGALVGVATSLVLGALASGLGFNLVSGSLVSPSALTVFTPTLGAFAMIVQILAGGFAGYIAGRLRHTWAEAHLDEAHFRDTAHGLLAWALATIVGLILAAKVVAPYEAQIASIILSNPVTTATTASDAFPQISAAKAAQCSFFIGIGMLLSAFVAAVAARIGGMRTEEMLSKPRL